MPPQPLPEVGPMEEHLDVVDPLEGLGAGRRNFNLLNGPHGVSSQRVDALGAQLAQRHHRRYPRIVAPRVLAKRLHLHTLRCD